MIGYRDGRGVFYCDGCHTVIEGKPLITVTRKGKKKYKRHFHDKECQAKYKPPFDRRTK